MRSLSIAIVLLISLLAACGASSPIAGTYTGKQTILNANSDEPVTTEATVVITLQANNLHNVLIAAPDRLALETFCLLREGNSLRCTFEPLGLSSVEYVGTANGSSWIGEISGGNSDTGIITGRFSFGR